MWSRLKQAVQVRPCHTPSARIPAADPHSSFRHPPAALWGVRRGVLRPCDTRVDRVMRLGGQRDCALPVLPPQPQLERRHAAPRHVARRAGACVCGGGAPLPVSSASLALPPPPQAELNGDGLMDFVYVNGWGSNESSTLYLSDGAGAWTQVRVGLGDGGKLYLSDGAGAWTQARTRRFGSPGLPPPCLPRVPLPRRPLQVPGPSFYVSDNVNLASSDIARIAVVDVNGDGRSDLYFATSGPAG